MRIVIATYGSLGDVRPLVALGAGLRAAGHDVVFPAEGAFRPLVERHGLGFVPLAGDFRTAMAGAAKDLFRRGTNPAALMRGLAGHAGEMAVPWARRFRAAAEGADAVLATGLAFHLGLSAAQAAGALPIGALLAPFGPTRAFPPPLVPPRRLPDAANLALHHGAIALVWLALRGPANRARREVFGLPPLSLREFAGLLKHGRLPLLHGYSPTLVPPPPDWPKTVRVTGAWQLPEGAAWTPPAALARFLARGPRPVYVGFGSMGGYDPAEATRFVLRALGGRRAVLASGWGGLSCAPDLPAEVLALEQAPHDWLLPRMAAAVHHGGAGTVHAAVRAGVPSVVVPFLGDQPFWGWRLERLGVAPAPIPRRRLTAETLAAALAAAEDPCLRARAAALGARLEAEDGVGAAVAAIEAAVAARR